MMSVGPSAASIKAPEWMTKSPVLVVLSLPSVMLPSAVKLTRPEPALITVSPVINNTSLPAFKVMFPLVLVRSASAVISMPAVAWMSMLPVTVMIGADKINRPEVLCNDTLLVPVAEMAAFTVKLPPATTNTCAWSVLVRLEMVSASASYTVMAPLALTDKVSASVVFASDPRVTAPLAADRTKLAELTMWPMVMLPVLEVMLTLPAEPKMSLITTSPSATMEMLPPPTMVMDDTFKAPV